MALLSAQGWYHATSCIPDPENHEGAMMPGLPHHSPGIPWFTKSPGPAFTACWLLRSSHQCQGCPRKMNTMTKKRDSLWRKHQHLFVWTSTMGNSTKYHGVSSLPKVKTDIWGYLSRSWVKQCLLGNAMVSNGSDARENGGELKNMIMFIGWANKHGQSSSCGKDSIHLNTT